MVSERDMARLIKKLMDEGRIIELGWIALRRIWIPPEASEQQITDLRWAFMAGAQHLWASLNAGLDEGTEPTEADEDRIRKIGIELDRFQQEIEAITGRSDLI